MSEPISTGKHKHGALIITPLFFPPFFYSKAMAAEGINNAPEGCGRDGESDVAAGR